MLENITLFTHSSIRIRTGAGTIYIDPYKIEGEPSDGDFILVTHDHYDHFSPDDIRRAAGEDCILIVPESMRESAQQAAGSVGKIVTVKPGEACETDGLIYEAVPAYNIMKPFHPKSAGWVGYIIEADGQRIYIAGDTDATKEAETVQCDIAMVPIGGTYTMNAKKAAGLINTIRPAAAIPTHYGSIVGKKKDAEEFASLVRPPVRVEIIMRE